MSTPAEENGTRPKRQLQLQWQKRTHHSHPGRRPLRLQLRTTSATARRRRNRPGNSPTRPTDSNQYTGIEESGEAPFVPTYDASGNQTLIRTSTGIWTVAYNAANRATSFTSRDGATVVECGYDYQGRRFMKKVTVTAQSPAMNAICTRLFADRPPWTAGHRTNRINNGEPSICFLCLS